MSGGHLDLRGLGDVDSPQVVSAALAEFRRRVWTRSTWVLAVMATVAALWFQIARPDDLRQRIDRADGVLTNAVYTAGEAQVGLSKVADLGETVGLELTALPSPGSSADGAPRGPELRVADTEGHEQTGAFDQWFEIRPPGDGVVRLRVLGSGCPDPAGCPIEIDLGALGVPASTWR